MTLPKDSCLHCTRRVRLATEDELRRFGDRRWVHVDSGLPWCLLKRGEA